MKNDILYAEMYFMKLRNYNPFVRYNTDWIHRFGLRVVIILSCFYSKVYHWIHAFSYYIYYGQGGVFTIFYSYVGRQSSWT